MGMTLFQRQSSLDPAAVVDVASMRAVRGWMLRAALGVVTVTAIIVAMTGAPGVGAISAVGVLLFAGAVGTVLVPGSVLPLVVLICLVLYRMAAVHHAPDAGLMALAALIALIHQLAGICAVVPARSACQWAALRPALLRYLLAVVPVEIALAVAIALA